jgi:phage baseplate assembly protein W
VSQPIAAAIPFSISQGGVAVEQSPVSQMRSRVTALASTQPGTRVMAGGFGVNTAHQLFAFTDPLGVQELAEDLRGKMRIYEPGAQLISVQPIADASGSGIASVVVNAVRKDTTSAVGAAFGRSSVTIGADGSVTDYASTTAM